MEEYTMKYSQEEKERALKQLHELLKPGDTVYTSLRHVSRSGMSRWINMYAIIDNEPVCIDHEVKILEDQAPQKHDGVYVGGCGMDMGFALVYNLSHYLFKDGYGCIGEKCPANDHCNGDRSYRKHMENNNNMPCTECNGTGKKMYGWNNTLTTCNTCNGSGTLSPEHWHTDGGYAIKHRWMA
jgi:hypothetical protein